MKFNCFPKKQKLYLVYSSYGGFKSKLFKHLYIQCSPKDSLFFRLLKSDIGFLISSMLKTEIETPTANKEYVGIIKGEKKVLFELKDNEPIKVWRQSKEKEWEGEAFLGYPLISEYTLCEFTLKYKLIEKALRLHWKNLNIKKYVHGDFTHFNILYDRDENFHIIDDKQHENSRLYDLFYFYSYLRQCLLRCQTLSTSDRNKILTQLDEIIKNVSCYKSKKEFIDDKDAMIFPHNPGIAEGNRDTFRREFFNLFENL